METGIKYMEVLSRELFLKEQRIKENKLLQKKKAMYPMTMSGVIVID